MRVKVLDIDRDRQRISLGLKQTQEDPWQRVVNTYNVGDVLEGKVTKVVSFGAFVEIMEGVEGLVHISELAQHHVENPREIVDPGDDGEGQDPRDRRRAPAPVAEPQARRGPGAAAARDRAGDAATGEGEPDAGAIGEVPDLDLSEEVFAGDEARGRGAGTPRQPPAEAEAEAPPRPSREQRRGAEAQQPSRRQPRARAPQSRSAAAPRRQPSRKPEAAAEPQPRSPSGQT